MKNTYKLKSIVIMIILTMLIGVLGCYSHATEVDTTNNVSSENETTTNTNESPSQEVPTQPTANTNKQQPATTSTQSSTTSTNKVNTKSSNANLSNLGIRPHDFTGFKSGTTSYTVTVPKDTESVEVYAKAENSNAKITGTGSISLQEGDNVANITVTAEDGTTKTYTIKIIRQASEETQEIQETLVEGNGLVKLVIQNVEMTPKFETNIYEYSAKYIGEKMSLPIEVESTDKSYKVEIVGNENLKEGENVITILVYQTNGDIIATYQITVEKSLVDEKALAKEQAEKEKTKKMIIGAIVATVLVIGIIIFIDIRRRRNRKYTEEYSEVPFYDINKNQEDNNYNDYNDDYDGKEENEEFDDLDNIYIDEEERKRVREKFLNGYNKNNQKEEDYLEKYEKETPRKKSKGKRYK